VNELCVVVVVVETEQEDDAFSGRVSHLVHQLTADTVAEQKLIAASVNSINSISMSVETTRWQ